MRWYELLVLLLVAGAALWDGLRIMATTQGTVGGPEAGAWLAITGSIAACLIGAFWIRSRRWRIANGEITGEGLRRVGLAFGILVAYTLLMDRLGYLIATTLFMIVYLRVFGSYRWIPIVVGSVVLAVGSTYTWIGLNLLVPEGILPLR